LLVTASSLAFFAAICRADNAEAADENSDQPTIWIELGGQLQKLDETQQSFSPSFMPSVTQANLLSALDVQRPSTYALDGEGKISFQPDGSDWVFSASVQYGRSSAAVQRHQQTANKTVPVSFNFPPPNSGFHAGPKYYYPYLHVRFADGELKQSETHGVVDFQAGKDVGIGLFGGKGTSVLSAGVRIAQFTSNTSVSLHVDPDVQYPTAPIHSITAFVAFNNDHPRFHEYGGSIDSERNFHGIGPSLSWNASAPVAGQAAQGELSLDWGVNGAVLFGRQKTSGQYKTVIRSYDMTAGWDNGFQQGKIKLGHFGNHVAQTCFGVNNDPNEAHYANVCKTNAAGFNRARSVTVPNLGGFAGASFRIQNFKVSAGYRADFFFGAMDGGIAAAKKENIGFYGPFASVSVGIGG